MSHPEQIFLFNLTQLLKNDESFILLPVNTTVTAVEEAEHYIADLRSD